MPGNIEGSPHICEMHVLSCSTGMFLRRYGRIVAMCFLRSFKQSHTPSIVYDVEVHKSFLDLSVCHPLFTATREEFCTVR